MPKFHTVKQGECIASIAFLYGFHPDTIWEHVENKEINELRKNPNVLFAGDLIFIPDKRLDIVDKPTNEVHKFRRLAVPEKFRLNLAWLGIPRADLPYKLVIDGLEFDGTTGKDGLIEQSIPPDAKKGKLIIEHKVEDEDEIEKEEYEFFFGSLDPTEEVSGPIQRLVNLGYIEREKTGKKEIVKLAIEEFQKNSQLDITGEIDDETRQKLIEVHGC